MTDRKGLTLIEIIISLAIIGMIAVVFLTVFNTGIINIFKTNDDTKNVYDIQEQVDALIESDQPFESGTFNKGNKKDIEIRVEDHEMELIINESSTQSVSGKLITGEKNGIKIITFVPDELEDE